MDNFLEKYGEYLLNPQQIVEVEFQSNKAVIYLSDGRVREIYGSEIMTLRSRFDAKEKVAPAKKDA